jgi:hypothetical protein
MGGLGVILFYGKDAAAPTVRETELLNIHHADMAGEYAGGVI